MPEICGRICPQDRLCEGNCVIEFSGHGAVTIGSVEKYITDTAWAEGWVDPVQVGPATGQSVGIVGTGPDGLAADGHLPPAGQARNRDGWAKCECVMVYDGGVRYTENK